jgi:hypothetical protein
MIASDVKMNEAIETAGDKGCGVAIDDGHLRHARARDSKRENGAKRELEINQSKVRERGNGRSNFS